MKHYLGYGALIVVAVALGLSWLRAHDAWIHAEATEQAQEIVRKHAEEDAKNAAVHSAEVAKNEAKEVEKIQTKASKPLSADEIRAFISEMLPKAEVQPVTLPNGQPGIAIPDTQENRNEIQAKKAECDICKVQREARDQQYADSIKRIEAKDQEIGALKLERDGFKTAAKHGAGFWARTKEWGIRAGFAAGGYGVGRLSRR